MPSWNDPTLNAIAGKFFREFARTEYALKVAGYLSGDDREAKPDWARFANANGQIVLQSDDLRTQKAVGYLLKAPPMKQVVIGGSLEWSESPIHDQPDHQRLFVFLRRIRNNLFHGGKFNGRWFQPDRSGELISHGLTILQACRNADPSLAEAYNN